ncbi:MAG: hypothetical protein PHQ98_00050 [Candidatus ainarchaeum sp.]|nr:hypothetical protein [Candidatus ainarchaeum sp.]
MYSKFFGLLLILLLSSIVYSSEISLNSLSVDNLLSIQKNELVCSNFSVDLSTIDKNNLELTPILSIKSFFDINKLKDNSYFLLKINDLHEEILWPNYFSCVNNDCYSRVFLPELSLGLTKIELCIQSGGNDGTIIIENSSKIGLYNSPYLEVKINSPEYVYFGDLVPMEIIIENKGLIDTNVFVQYVSGDLRKYIDIDSLDIVYGQSQAYSLIKSHEKKSFNYMIKPKKLSTYNLPRAAVTFKNIFDENQIIFTKNSSLNVIKKEDVELLIYNEKFIDNVFYFDLKIKNISLSDINGYILISPIDLFNINQFVTLSPSQELIFTNIPSNNLKNGDYSFTAIFDSKNNKFLSNSIDYKVNNFDNFYEIIFSIIAILISIIIFGFINYKSK